MFNTYQNFSTTYQERMQPVSLPVPELAAALLLFIWLLMYNYALMSNFQSIKSHRILYLKGKPACNQYGTGMMMSAYPGK